VSLSRLGLASVLAVRERYRKRRGATSQVGGDPRPGGPLTGPDHKVKLISMLLRLCGPSLSRLSFACCSSTLVSPRSQCSAPAPRRARQQRPSTRTIVERCTRCDRMPKSVDASRPQETAPGHARRKRTGWCAHNL
jgi:hypothetical protein